MKKAKQHGGKRKGAGRKKGEETKVIRVPASLIPQIEALKKRTSRVRITKPNDPYSGMIGYIAEVIEQHSLYTYVVRFKTKHGLTERRAYQRNEFSFLKPVKTITV